MRKYVWLIIVAIVTAGVFLAITASRGPKHASPRFVENELIVTFKPEVSTQVSDGIVRSLTGVTVLVAPPEAPFYQIRVEASSGVLTSELARKLRTLPEVQDVENVGLRSLVK